MDRQQRWVAAAGIVAVLAIGGALSLAAFIAVGGGVASVRVVDREGGLRLYLPLPADALVAGAAVARRAVTGDRGSDAAARSLAAALPLVDGVLAALEECPDATLVEVRERGETVRVRKRRGALRIEVDAEPARIEVTAPVRALRRAARALSGA